MKVILEAFNGMLHSEVLDWPDDGRPTIQMLLDMPKFRAFELPADGKLSAADVIVKRGVFERQPNSVVIDKFEMTNGLITKWEMADA